MASTLYLVAYSPSSPHRLQDIAKLAFSMSFVTALITIKPVGMAAQAGVPEVFRLAYKLNKRFIVLPRLQDLKELLSIDDILFIVHTDEAPDICEVILDKGKNIGIVVQAGETPFLKEDLLIGRYVRLSELDSYRSPNAVADAAIALTKLYRLFTKGSC